MERTRLRHAPLRSGPSHVGGAPFSSWLTRAPGGAGCSGRALAWWALAGPGWSDRTAGTAVRGRHAANGVLEGEARPDFRLVSPVIPAAGTRTRRNGAGFETRLPTRSVPFRLVPTRSFGTNSGMHWVQARRRAAPSPTAIAASPSPSTTSRKRSRRAGQGTSRNTLPVCRARCEKSRRGEAAALRPGRLV